jgi:hypothetical protein
MARHLDRPVLEDLCKNDKDVDTKEFATRANKSLG